LLSSHSLNAVRLLQENAELNGVELEARRKLQSEPTVFSQSVGCPVQLGELLSPDGSMRMAKLDDLIDRVEVIKIDVEGMISTRCSQGGGLSTATVQ
jgi:hypothetical protein